MKEVIKLAHQPRPTRGPEAAHILCGNLHLESFSNAESRYLAAHLGDDPSKAPAFAGAGQSSAVLFGMLWAREFMSKQEVQEAKRLLGEMHPGDPDAPPAPKKTKPAKKKKAKKKEPAFDVADLPISDKAKDALRDAGLLTPEDIKSEGVDGLIELPSIGAVAAKKILDALGG